MENQQIQETVNEIKKNERFMIQIINHENGYRSEPFLTDWDGLRTALKASEENGPTEDDYILLVAVMRDEETIIPQAPLITIKSFLEMD